MKRPYFASRNHSRRFSRAGSGAGRGVCAAQTPIKTKATTKTRKHEEDQRLMSSSEDESHRHLHDARIAGRDRLAEVRIHLIARRVESGGLVHVRELKPVADVIGLDAELQPPH